MRYAIIMSIYGRKKLTDIVLDYYKEKQKKYGFEMLIAGSENQPVGWAHYFEVPNSPLTGKYNRLVKEAQKLNVDGIVLMGSDDFMSDGLFEYYKKFSGKEEKYHGLANCYFYSVQHDELIFVINEHQTVGSGRFYSKRILDKMNWQLWNGDLDKNIDANCRAFLGQYGIHEKFFTLRQAKGMLVDIKYENNITQYENIKNLKNYIKDKKLMKKYLGEKWFDKIMSLKESNE